MLLTRRAAALVAGIPLVLAGLTVTGIPVAQAAPEPKPVTQGVAWLEGQLVDGVLPGTYGPSYGPSIDAALSLTELGGHDATVTKIANAIRTHYYDYVTGGEWGPDDFYAGPVAKALVIAQVAGTKPASYVTGVRAQLESMVVESGANTGRIRNDGDYPDSNVTSQALATRALAVAGSSEAGDVEDFLLLQQCSAGFFREGFSPEAAADQSCDAASGTPSIDTTAFTVIYLQAIPSPSPEISTAIDDAQAWLAGQQSSDGSWNAGNANSTGLAAWALGDGPEAKSAAKWLRDHQADDTDRCTALRGDIGAVALDDAALAAGRKDGITAASSDQWRVAAAQVLPALGYLDDAASRTLTLTGPAGYVKAGGSVTYQTGGAASGARLCVSTDQAGALGTATAAGQAVVALTLPAGTANRTVTVTDRDGNTATATTKALGATTLSVKAKKKVKRNKLVKITVKGLAPGERVTVKLRKKKVSGTANAKGTFKVKVKAGKKLGKAKIAVTGEFGNRTGKAKVKVRK